MSFANSSASPARAAVAGARAIVAHGLAAIVFALLPTLGAFTAHTLVYPPHPEGLIRAMLFTAAGVWIICLLLRGLGYPAREAGLAVALAALTFALFPMARNVLSPDVSTASAAIFAWSYVACSFGVGLALLHWPRPATSPLYPAINIVAVVLAAGMMLQVWRAYGAVAEVGAGAEPERLASLGTVGADTRRVDVYHIILDGFGRPDVLQHLYQVDLADLIAALEARGFEVARQRATANYAQTVLSVASMLNARYVNDVAGPETMTRAPLYDLIQRSSVIAQFKRLGYEINFLGSIYSATSAHSMADSCECSQPLIGEFESTIIHMTPWRDTGLMGLDYIGYRDKIRRGLAVLETLEPPTRPRFLLAHILSPHLPFVFDANGAAVVPPRTLSFDEGSWFPGTAAEYEHGYREQTRHIKARLIPIVDRIQRTSRQAGREPFIILHGDHGPRFRFDANDATKTDASESLPVFLAIHWPSHTGDTRAPVTSLVNVYREFFRRVFGLPLELLPDRAFVSSFREPYRFLEVDPDVWQGNEH